jgi:hypothetical protein
MLHFEDYPANSTVSQTGHSFQAVNELETIRWEVGKLNLFRPDKFRYPVNVNIGARGTSVRPKNSFTKMQR